MKMGKHKNTTQNAIIMEFMEKYPDIAKGFTKRDKTTVDALWQELAESLNGAGPPQYDVNGWKKKWTEWKSEVKRKLAQNKAESRATGGGPFTKHMLTTNEESIVRLCCISQSVEGVSGIAIGVNEEVDITTEEEMPSTSSKRPVLVGISNTPKRVRCESTGERLKKFLDEDNKRKIELNDKLDELIKTKKENATAMRRIYRAIEKGNESVADAITDCKNQFASFTTTILKQMQEKNELKKRQLDLELQKFDYEKNSKRDV